MTKITETFCIYVDIENRFLSREEISATLDQAIKQQYEHNAWMRDKKELIDESSFKFMLQLDSHFNDDYMSIEWKIQYQREETPQETEKRLKKETKQAESNKKTEEKRKLQQAKDKIKKEENERLTYEKLKKKFEN